MKIYLVFFILGLLSFFGIYDARSQSFEGEIIYQNSVQSKVPTISDEQFGAMMGTKQEYYVKDDKYKSVTNGSYAQMQLYVPSENRLYNKLAISDTLMWFDGSINNDEVLNHEILENQQEVLGYQCDALVVTTKSGKTTYYFNKKIKANPKHYKDHRFGNWGFFIEQTEALPLKLKIEAPQFSMVSTATDIVKKKLEDSFFDLPEGPVKKSPF